MANDHVTISPILSEKETDFSLLLRQGIDLVQQYSGSIWTDYNEHDPGITVLEELCFVITELYLRAGMSINDILTGPDGAFPAADNAFYTAAEILHNHPLTPDDFRRIVVDSFKEVSNAWIEPIATKTTPAGEIGITGMYKVLLDLSSKTVDKASIEAEVKEVLNLHRNLCETFVQVVSLEQEPVAVSFDVYVDSSASVEDLLANLLLNMQKYIRPEVDFYTLAQLQERGWDTSDIFEGPRLLHGFVPREELKPRVTEIRTTELLKFAFNVQGTRSISNLSVFKTGDQENAQGVTGHYKVSEGKVAVLDIESTLDKINVYSNNVTCHFNKNLVMSRINELNSKTGQSRKVNLPASQLDIPIETGTYQAPGKYFSLQHDFPAIYGIGPSGPADDRGLRKAQALQLKAYLLFFEQVLADFLSQLENLRNVFSISTQHQTYFYQPVYTVPGIEDIVDTSKPGPAVDINQYESGLKKIYGKVDNVTERRKQFLGHLLNRFGLDPYVFSHPETMGEGADPFFNDIVVGQEMLQKAPVITCKRGAADIKGTSARNQWPVSGLEEIIALTTGMRYAAYAPVYGEFNYVEMDGEDVWIKDENGIRQYKLAAQDPHFFSVLYAGMSFQNYTYRQEDGAIYLNAPSPVRLLWVPKETNHDEVINDLIVDFTSLYFGNEKFFLIDHIQLKPDNAEANFGWINPGEAPLQDTYENTLLQVPNNAAEDLFYVISATGQPLTTGFYSNRASVMVPKTAFDTRSNAFREYLNYLLATYAPAHLCVQLVILEDNDYYSLVNAYALYVAGDPEGISTITGLLLQQEDKYTEMIFDGGSYK